VVEEVVMELGIGEVARLTGTTSRTLRHYQDVGLLVPSRTGTNGYRYYDAAALRRLQRILLLRDLGLGIPAIAAALDRADEASALRAHLGWLRAEVDRIGRQIVSVERTISSIEHEEELMAEQMFEGFDHTRYQEEVEQRWGADAWAEGDRWWRGLGPEGRARFGAEHQAIAARWAELRAAGAPVDGPQVQDHARRHRAWIQAGWQGREVSPEALMGLAEMYVADERFAANYGGVEGAAYVRDALTHLAVEQAG
jgi:DNA-binding transcriptional MerR regulator